MKKLCLLLALGMLICLPGMALADTFTGNYGLYDNYPQNYPTASVDLINTIDAYISSGAVTFAAPGIMNYDGSFTAGGWTGAKITDTFAQATTSTASGAVAWDYTFADGSSAPFSIDVNFFDGKTFMLHEQTVVYGYQDFTDVYNSTEYTPVPLPPSVLLLGSGLFSLGLLGRRKVFKA